jgi:TatD DNase family protein
MLRYFDAHNHLQDERLQPHLQSIAAQLPQLGLSRAVVAASGEADWASVADLANLYPWVQPSFGIHPWHVQEQSPTWAEQLQHWLSIYPHAGIGEAGLDRWIQQPDIPLQLHMLRTQLRLARELHRPITLHCLRAFGLMEEELRTQPHLEHGFLLHSYSGPAEMLPAFTKLGAYFSVSPYFLHPRKAQQWQTFRSVPLERLLVETDAPDMWPPQEINPLPLSDPEGKAINHPANIQLIYTALAELRSMSISQLAQIVEDNFKRLFQV